MSSNESHAATLTSTSSNDAPTLTAWEKACETAQILGSADLGALRVLYDKVKARPVVFSQNNRVLQGDNLWIDMASGNEARIDVFLENPFDPSQKKKIISEVLDLHTLENKKSDKHGVVRAEVGFLKVSFKRGETRYPISCLELTFGNDPNDKWCPLSSSSNAPKSLKKFVSLLRYTHIYLYNYVPKGNDQIDKLQNLIKAFAAYSEKYAQARESFQLHFDNLTLLQCDKAATTTTVRKSPLNKHSEARPAKKTRKA